MNRVLVAGATGYLGHYLVSVLHERGCWVRALSRSEAKLADSRTAVDDVFIGEVTRPETLHGVADEVEVVISAIGITRQKDGLTYDDVDYRGNLNLLQEAQASGVKKFIYVSVLNVDGIQNLKIVQAKEKFVQALRASGLDYTVIRPNGYFSDMREFLAMARRGRVMVFGNGSFHMNPIHGQDVAEVCADAIDGTAQEISFGGPEVYTHRQIAEAAFEAVGRKPQITSVPTFVANMGLWFLRHFTSTTFYGPLEFTLTVLTRDMVAETRGEKRLADFYLQEARLSVLK